jgi:ribosomal-protein-alanine acetyltransferase
MIAIFKRPELKLRPMREADLQAVMAIERRAYEYPWSEGIFRDCLRIGYGCWVMEKDGMIQGYGVMSVAEGESHILNLCVQPQMQGQGLGRKLLEHLLTQSRRLGVDTALLEVRPSNIRAIKLYRDMGFNEVGMRQDYYPAKNDREDALILAINLTSFSA